MFTARYFEEYMEKLTVMMNEKEEKIVQYNSEEQIKIINIYTSEKMEEIKKVTQNGTFKIQDVYTILNSYEIMLNTVIK
jgi:phosphoribosylanthranilate isomerase